MSRVLGFCRHIHGRKHHCFAMLCIRVLLMSIAGTSISALTCLSLSPFLYSAHVCLAAQHVCAEVSLAAACHSAAAACALTAAMHVQVLQCFKQLSRTSCSRMPMRSAHTSYTSCKPSNRCGMTCGLCVQSCVFQLFSCSAMHLFQPIMCLCGHASQSYVCAQMHCLCRHLYQSEVQQSLVCCVIAHSIQLNVSQECDSQPAFKMISCSLMASY